MPTQHTELIWHVKRPTLNYLVDRHEHNPLVYTNHVQNHQSVERKDHILNPLEYPGNGL